MGQLRDALASYPQQTLTKAQMQELGFSPEPQGVALVLRQTPQILPESGTLRPGTWVGVESIRTPGNLGTILRSMVATGSPGVFLFGNQGRYQDIYEPGVIRASMGAHLRLKVVKTTYREFARWTYRSEFRVLGADAKGSLEYRSVNYRRLLLFMIGDERSGLSPGQRSACDDLVRIPMAAEIDSLNVAMAATVLLFESFGQRRAVRRGR
jgi:TrmH family RNA methyltransferase